MKEDRGNMVKISSMDTPCCDVHPLAKPKLLNFPELPKTEPEMILGFHIQAQQRVIYGNDFVFLIGDVSWENQHLDK